MNILKRISLTLRLIKVQRFIGSFVYPLQRDWLERKFRNSKPIEIYEPSGNLIEAKAIAGKWRVLL
jgi:alpha-glucosidase